MDVEGKIVVSLLERIAVALEKGNELEAKRLEENIRADERHCELQNKSLEQIRASRAHEEIERRQLGIQVDAARDQAEHAERLLAAQKILVEDTTGRSLPGPARVMHLVRDNRDVSGATSALSIFEARSFPCDYPVDCEPRSKGECCGRVDHVACGGPSVVERLDCTPGMLMQSHHYCAQHRGLLPALREHEREIEIAPPGPIEVPVRADS
jgi:hypothetical protein